MKSIEQDHVVCWQPANLTHTPTTWQRLGAWQIPLSRFLRGQWPIEPAAPRQTGPGLEPPQTLPPRPGHRDRHHLQEACSMARSAEPKSPLQFSLHLVTCADLTIEDANLQVRFPCTTDTGGPHHSRARASALGFPPVAAFLPNLVAHSCPTLRHSLPRRCQCPRGML